jgi:predicted transcriptional regulator of viral defense system
MAKSHIYVEKCEIWHQTAIMDKKQETRLRKLGVFTRSQAEAMGLRHQSLSRLVEEGKIIRVGRGMYLHSDGNLGRDIDYQVACMKFGPQSVIGGLTALFHYNLIEQVPGQVWVLVPPTQTTHTRLYRLIRTKVKLDRWTISENGYRIVTVERAVLEGLKMANKIGERTAVQAARAALGTRQTTEGKLGMAAKELGFDSVLTRYFEVITT